MNITLKGQFYCAKAVMPHMMKQKSGSIVNISSVVAYTAFPGSAAYCAAKAGVIALTKALARELAPHNVSVNCIAPGFISSPLQKLLSPEVLEATIQAIPVGRPGQPEEVAKDIMLLASAEFVTGQTWVVDGGQLMR
jgi:3-oxoacyl-[acyl-carrier protein] reductase